MAQVSYWTMKQSDMLSFFHILHFSIHVGLHQFTSYMAWVKTVGLFIHCLQYVVWTQPWLFNICTIADKRQLWSAGTGSLSVPRTRTTLGMRSFVVASPVVWNSLPTALRSVTLCPLTFTRYPKSDMFDWLIVRLRTIYDALYKSTYRHYHHCR